MSQESDEVWWADIKEHIMKITAALTVTFMLMGLLGNILTMLVMVSKEFAKMQIRFVLVALAISDLTFIVTHVFNKSFMVKLTGRDIRALSVEGCKMFYLVYRTMKMTSSWLVVMVCMERFISVVLPFKRNALITNRTVIIAIIVNYVFNSLYNGLWTVSTTVENNICKQNFPSPENTNLHKALKQIGTILFSIIPLAIMIVLTPVIVYRLYQQQAKKRNMRAGGTFTNDSGDIETFRVSAMLVAVVVAYVVFIMPVTVVHFAMNSSQHISIHEADTLGYFVIIEVVQLLELLNYSTNFIMYVLGSRKFRQSFFKLLHLQNCLLSKPDEKSCLSETDVKPQPSFDQFSKSVCETTVP
ncbi:hypothetical protein DPMN_114427 [Dreissena polymorpha]|uniref:G-protein coupled receptors family 1 profile domain-containing protein n=2 Tax=Dreissena polymorpha TaxID=45954 RepID=A0A9D4KK35_DREPO|nr:hypothetical protein DPMN_114427 [Dreissena polymorpha]